ncbi:hypothetical protein LDENG_00187840 [Lucifuga dentata]|nr:hypothetical protein LDENG_00187840 [Lucifuga dentata]
MSLEVGGSRSTRREPTRTRGEHANSTQKGPAPAGNQTQDLLAVRQQLTAAPPCRISYKRFSEMQENTKNG